MTKASCYRYSNEFFDFVDISSGRSASAFLAGFAAGFMPESVLDVGCGRGVWLAAWAKMGVTDICGVDGEYVDRAKLKIDGRCFFPHDIATPFTLDVERKFSLVQCLEVAEHICVEHADMLISNLVAHGDIILFSAAQPGQGGEHHVNEQPVSYWLDKFAHHGYEAFDYPRMRAQENPDIEPWYRYNTLLYANDNGQASLGEAVLDTKVSREQLKEYRSTAWRVRCWVLALLPQSVIFGLAILKHRFQNWRYQ